MSSSSGDHCNEDDVQSNYLVLEGLVTICLTWSAIITTDTGDTGHETRVESRHWSSGHETRVESWHWSSAGTVVTTHHSQ